MGKRLRRFVGKLTHALDRAAFAVAPGPYSRRKTLAHLLRLQDRMLANREAGETPRTDGGWLGSKLSPDSDLEASLATYRVRARELYYDDPLIHGYVEGSVTNIIGRGVKPQARIQTGPKGPGVSDERAKALNESLESLWRRWAKGADPTGRKSFRELQRLAVRIRKRDGEVFVVLSDVDTPGRPLPLAVEVVDPGRVATPPEKEGDKLVRLGIEKNAKGEIVAYHIRTTPPADTKDTEETYERVPADRVLHNYEQEDADQSRGVPSCASITRLSKDTKDYEEAILIKKRVEACATLFISTGGSPEAVATAAAFDTNSNSQRLEEMNPGSVHYGQPGEEPQFFNPGQGGGAEHTGYMGLQHHKFAAGLQYPFELLTKAYGGTNYSSGRLSLLDGRAVFQAEQQAERDKFYIPVWERFTREAVLFGKVAIGGAEYQRDPESWQRSAWIPPGWPWVDPVKEVKADELAVANKFTTRTMVNAARGLDDEEVRQQRVREDKGDAEDEKEILDHRKKIGLAPVEEPEPTEQPQAGQNRVRGVMPTETPAGNGQAK